MHYGDAKKNRPEPTLSSFTKHALTQSFSTFGNLKTCELQHPDFSREELRKLAQSGAVKRILNL